MNYLKKIILDIISIFWNKIETQAFLEKGGCSVKRIIYFYFNGTVSVMSVACSLSVFLSMCLFVLCVLCLTVLVNCLLNAFTSCMGEVIVFSLKVMVLVLGCGGVL